MNSFKAHWPIEFRNNDTSDPPQDGACPVLRNFVIVGQDNLPDDLCQRLLRPRVPRIINSYDPMAEEARLRCIVVETARGIVPMALDAIACYTASAALRALTDDAKYAEIERIAWVAHATARSTAQTAQVAAEAAQRLWESAQAAAWNPASPGAARAAGWAVRDCALVGNAFDVWNKWAGVLDKAFGLGKA